MSFISLQFEGGYSPGFSTLPALLSVGHFIARPCKSALVADQRPRELHTESSDPHRLWDQVHNVQDQYTQGIVPQPLSVLSSDLAPVYEKDFGFHKDMGLFWISGTELRRIICDIVFAWFDGTLKQERNVVWMLKLASSGAKPCLLPLLFSLTTSKHQNMYF